MITCSSCEFDYLKTKSMLVRDETGEHICQDCKDLKKDKNVALYWKGSKNKAIRYYFYSQRGLALLNEARYLVMGVFALYFALRLDNPVYMILMFSIAVPVLIFFGWLSVHHIGKVVDWLNIKFSTHYGKYQITLLEEIRDALKRR